MTTSTTSKYPIGFVDLFDLGTSFDIPENPALNVVNGLNGYEVEVGYSSKGQFVTCRASNFLRRDFERIRLDTQNPSPEEGVFSSLGHGLDYMFGDLVFQVKMFNSGNLDNGRYLTQQVVKYRIEEEAKRKEAEKKKSEAA